MADEISQREKREVMFGDSLSQRASAAAELEKVGRFAPVRPQLVVGADPGPQYPSAAYPFQCDPTGIEPPLGFSVDDQVPVGEPHDIEKAAQILSEQTSASPAPSWADAGASGAVDRVSLGSVDPAPDGIPIKPRRRF